MAPPMPALPVPAGSGSIAPFVAPPPARDHTQDLPDEILTLVFASLTPAERNACSGRALSSKTSLSSVSAASQTLPAL